MSRSASPILEGIASLYQSFFLRDLLGFTLPGFIAGMSLWWLVVRPECGPLLECIAGQLGRNVYPAEAVVVVGASYLVGLVMQAVHFLVFDWVLVLLSGPGKFWARVFMPFLAFREYTRTDAEHNVELSRMSTLVLFTDSQIATTTSHTLSDKVLHALKYHERLGVLTVTRGNLAIAGALLVAALERGELLVGSVRWAAYVVVALVYLEGLRTSWFRNLRFKLYAHDWP